MTHLRHSLPLLMLMVFALSACDKQDPSKEAPKADTPKVDAQKTDNKVDATKTDPTKPQQNNAPGDSEKIKDIRKLLVLTGSGKLGEQVMGTMIANYRRTMPSVPQKFWDDFQKEANASALVELIVPIYDKHFTHDDIKGMITFYESPLGKKMVGAMPQITQESMAAGQKWGMELGTKVQNKLKAQGHIK